LGPLSQLFLGDDFIPYVSKAKQIGVTFNYDQSSVEHASTVCLKVYGALAGLFADRMRLIVALVIPFSLTAIVYTLHLTLIH
jgi:hypothetical protein